MDPNAPWKDSENATNAPSFRLWVHLRCNLGAGRVHLYQTRSQHFRINLNDSPNGMMLTDRLLNHVRAKLLPKKIQAEFSLSFWIFVYSVAVIISMALPAAAPFVYSILYAAGTTVFSSVLGSMIRISDTPVHLLVKLAWLAKVTASFKDG